MRQRLRNHLLRRALEADGFCAADIVAALGGGLPSIAVPGLSNAMSDALALQAFRLDLALACDELDLPQASIYLAPSAVLHDAIASDRLSEDARLQALSVAFEMFRREYRQITAPRRDRDAPVQRGSATAELTFADANQLRRAMNFCMAVYAAFVLHVGNILLSRIGTHSVESHFGIIRSVLRGVSSWQRWLDAETFAGLVPRFRESLGLPRNQPRRSRVLPVGALALRGSGGALFAGDEQELLAAARAFVDGERPQVMIDYLYLLLEATEDVTEPANPQPFAGVTSQARVMRQGA
jgi:hypothetical protein